MKVVVIIMIVLFVLGVVGVLALYIVNDIMGANHWKNAFKCKGKVLRRLEDYTFPG